MNDGVRDIKDLNHGTQLEGTITTVAQCGASVDVGVHQRGVVHVSQLANGFFKDARAVVKTGDIVKVRVAEVDLARGRMALTIKLDTAPAPAANSGGHRPAWRDERMLRGHRTAEMQQPGAMALAWSKLRR